jgi:hypothetical protein
MMQKLLAALSVGVSLGAAAIITLVPSSPASANCPPGFFEYAGNDCRRVPICLAGWHREGGHCVKTVSCLAGLHVSGDHCELDER